MSQTTPGPQAQTQTPPLVVNIQYVKDMSFEVPNAPAIYTQLRAQPQVNINLDVNARRIQENQHVYEVTLMIRAEAREAAPGQPGVAQAQTGVAQTGVAQTNVAQSGNGQGGNGRTGGGQVGGGQAAPGAPTVFVAELAYAGVFTLNNLPDNAIEPVLLVECPRILFPFARNILADITRDGGFPPVLLQPIDFVALWQSRRQGQTEATAQA